MATDSDYFSGALNYDIISGVSDSIQIYCYNGTGTSGTQVTTDNDGNYLYFFGRYFYLGNLLIQFCDCQGKNSSGEVSTQLDRLNSGNTYTYNFPISYDTPPFNIVLGAAKGNSNDNLNVYATLTTIASDNFSFHVGQDNGNITWVAIGPRPSSSTSSS